MTIQHFLAENPSKVVNEQQQHKGVIFYWSRISTSLVKLFQIPSLHHPSLCRANTAWDMQWRYREKRNDQEHHVSFFHIAKFWMFVFFVFEKMSSSIPMFLVMLLAHVGKRSNSRSQMFSKTGVLKNFAIFTGKNLCWSLFLIKFQDWRPTFLFKKRLQRRCFSVNIAKFLRTAFLLKTCSLYHYKFLFDDR